MNINIGMIQRKGSTEMAVDVTMPNRCFCTLLSLFHCNAHLLMVKTKRKQDPRGGKTSISLPYLFSFIFFFFKEVFLFIVQQVIFFCGVPCLWYDLNPPSYFPLPLLHHLHIYRIINW